jgi:hypothetical protein
MSAICKNCIAQIKNRETFLSFLVSAVIIAQMIRLTLSDFAGDSLRAAATQRQTDYEARYASYEREIAEKENKAIRLKATSKQRWDEGRVGGWLISFFPRIFHFLAPNPSPPRMARAEEREYVWAAGAVGEQVVADFFARALNDEWTLISGYKGYKGEIDQILVGPLGVLAIEIKSISGVIYVDGDWWYRDKYDRWGNLVERGLPIADRGGRSPSVQLNQATDSLEYFLQKRAPEIGHISRAVIVAHERSRIGEVSNQTVELIAAVGAINDSVFSQCFRSGITVNTQKIISLIKQDHEYQKSRRQRR